MFFCRGFGFAPVLPLKILLPGIRPQIAPLEIVLHKRYGIFCTANLTLNQRWSQTLAGSTGAFFRDSVHGDSIAPVDGDRRQELLSLAANTFPIGCVSRAGIDEHDWQLSRGRK